MTHVLIDAEGVKPDGVTPLAGIKDVVGVDIEAS